MKPQNARKMKKSYTYLTMLLAVFALVSCVKEFENTQAEAVVDGTPIEFTISDEATRMLLDLTDGKSLSWEDGDQVGLYYRSRITSPTNQDTMVAENVPYRYDSQTGKFVPVGKPATWGSEESGDQHNLYVYYPYMSDAEAYNKIAKAIPSTQTYDVTATANPIAQLGFAGARAQNVTYGKPVIFPALSQSFAIFRLNITNNTVADVNVSSVLVSNDSKDLADNRVMTMVSFVNGAPKMSESGSGGSKSITVNVENGVIKAGECIDVRMVILPQDYTNSKFNVTVTSDMGEHPVVEFDGGNIAIGGRASKNIVISADSDDYKIGSLVSGGVLYKVDGNTGYVLYPHEGKAQFARDASKMTDDLIKHAEDGMATLAMLKTKSPDLTDYPAVKYCNDIGEGWYLPSENEWIDLFNVYTGNDTGSVDSFKKATSELDEKYRAARTVFDSYLTNCGGDQLSTPADKMTTQTDGKVVGSNFWIGTITTTKGIQPRYSRVDYYTMGSTKPTSNYKVRCIKRVNLSNPEQPDTEVEETYPAPVAGEEGEYDVYLLIGQSNMAGRGEMIEGDDEEFHENVYILDGNGEPELAKNPLNWYSTIRKTDGEQKIGPGFSFSKKIAEETHRKILLVVNARGGSAIAEWAKGTTTSIKVGNATTATSLSFYDEAVRRTQQAMEYGALKGILWHQGCSDQSNTSYMTLVSALAENLRKDLGADVPFIVGQLGDWRNSPNIDNFNNNIKNIRNYLIYSDWVSSEGGVPIVTADSHGQPDLTDPHFNRASQIMMGERYAEKILKMVYPK